MTKPDVEAIVETHLIKWTNTIQLQFYKAFKSILEDALQPGYSNSNDGFKYAIFDDLEQSLHTDVLSSHAPSVFHAEMLCLIQTKFVAYMIE